MSAPQLICLPTVDSTNTWARNHAAELPHLSLVMAREQTAGHGQRGNTWESAPGENLTCTMLLRCSDVRPAAQFVISLAVSLAVVRLVDSLTSGSLDPARVKVKWPNDIYIDDRKVGGILIEHSVSTPERIDYTIAGLGLNLNQMKWFGDAPNPASLRQLIGQSFQPDAVAVMLQHFMAEALEADHEALHKEYMQRLWRADGQHHPFRLPDGTRFEAAIEDVMPDGHLCLIASGTAAPRLFAFKEVIFEL